MGQVQSAFDPDTKNVSRFIVLLSTADSKNNSPEGYIVPKFPSLYNPSISSTIQQRGYFLHDAEGELYSSPGF